VPSFRTGTVSSILAERAGLQRVEIAFGGADDPQRAYVLTRLIGAVEVGDRVVANTTAVELGLGTGGWHVVHWNLARDHWEEAGAGRVMKLRYTSLQADTGAAEEEPGFRPPADLGGRPVVACMLHSQVACVAAAYAASAPGRRLVYVMTDGGALPLALSDLVPRLRASGLLAATVTAGQAFGGDHEAVNVASALDVAVAVAGADAIVVGTGPGVVGTASATGFSALEAAAAVDAAGNRGGRPILAVRVSEADHRPRHRGVSHHVVAVLAHIHEAVVLAAPRGEATLLDDLAVMPADGPGPRHRVVEVDVAEPAAQLAGYGLEVTTMGRGVAEDPVFFRWAAAAGVAAGLTGYGSGHGSRQS
jgi:hypothetical protein